MSTVSETQSVQVEQVQQVQQKPVLPVVTRVFRRKETGGGLRRVVTIKYQYDRTQQKLTYAGSVWKSPVNCKEKYVANEHLKTVEKRFQDHPVVLENFTDESKLFDFHQKVRKQLFKHGCRASVSTA